jgi:hypothetical protein
MARLEYASNILEPLTNQLSESFMAKLNSTLTVERLREALHYDPDTGIFTWKIHAGRLFNGMVAGGKSTSHGYKIICIDRQRYHAHRLAWLYVYGSFPDEDIDYINNVRDDNRIANLRPATLSDNAQNLKKAKKQNKCGLLGVTGPIKGATGDRWYAQITKNRVHYFLGSYLTPEEAHTRYLEAKREMHRSCTI